ncbi:hypothetical protein EHS15_11955 [Leptospira idonii]|uniref:Uncharacterized protein n=1 Tax=Leptospira idonii TaxID=1193500 RepID=A0A4R9LYT8_9LEPT|nr:hypothetical protein EHS15_11955 [Leptospira idonii]
MEKNLLTFLISCNGGSLQACQSQCAAAYPVVTGENFPAVSACQTNCSTNCNLSTVYLLITAK